MTWYAIELQPPTSLRQTSLQVRQESYDSLPRLAIRDSGERHAGSGKRLLRVGKELVQPRVIPDRAILRRLQHGFGIEALVRTVAEAAIMDLPQREPIGPLRSWIEGMAFAAFVQRRRDRWRLNLDHGVDSGARIRAGQRDQPA